MKTKDKLIITALIFAAVFLVIYSIRSILPPFICSLVIAYFLNPVVDKLVNKYKFSRIVATSLIVGIFLLFLILICITVFPIIYSQLVSLIDIIPQYFKTFTQDFYPKIATTLNKFGFKMQIDFSNFAKEKNIDLMFVNLSHKVFNGALSSSIVIINILSLIFITPILIFYFLKDWHLITKKIDEYLPKKLSPEIHEITKNINKTLSSYVIGQFNVCIILGIIYASLLSITSLNFGFLIGLLTGILSFIPYVGMVLGVAASIIVALFQWGFDISHILSIVAVFIFGQIIESNFLTPKLIGSKIGLHPTWIIFGLFFFATLFGFIGILIAVPLTAVCGVIIKHLAKKYKTQ